MSEVRITNNSQKVRIAMDGAIFRALSLMGMAGESHAVQNMNKPMPHADGSSRPYIDTGNLQNSISNIVHGNSACIGTNVEYGVYIHEGTRKITPNRFLRDAVAEHVDEYKAILAKILMETKL